ncbi:hypothetical protein ABZ154_22160 [Streptomyces sp. NPDC006261]
MGGGDIRPASSNAPRERQIHAATLARALRVLDGERRAGRVAVPPTPN